MTDEVLALDAQGVSKTFDRNLVLDNLRLQVKPGSVHALLGHNGSGKSTFIKVLAGYYTADSSSGPVYVGGTPLVAGNPESSRKAGVTFVHQTLGLIPSLSVLENLRLGKIYRRKPWGAIQWRVERAAARDELQGFGLDIDPSAQFGRLSAVERTGVAIVRALGEDPGNNRLLVLDEPTSALDEAEVRRLFKTIRFVQDRGVGVLYVSHRLEEVEQIANEVTVLRDGVCVGEGRVANFSVSRLVELISGDAGRVETEPEERVARARTVGTESDVPRLRVQGLSAGGLRNLSLEGRAGEILGVVGLVGSGVDDLMPIVTADRRLQAGSIWVDGTEVNVRRISATFKAGVALVSAERSYRVVQDLTVRENLSLPVLHRFFKGGFLRRRAEDRYAAEAADDFDIRPRRLEAVVRTLSGGNQQKVAVARAIRTFPKIFVLEEPTQGVDAGGRVDIHRMLRAAAASGSLVVVIDSDLDEVAELCTRVVVLRGGVVVAELRDNEISRMPVLQACYGGRWLETDPEAGVG